MRFSSDQLRDKALLALEEVAQESRYRPVRRTILIRFALMYLWAISKGDRRPFDDFWEKIAYGNALHRYGFADTALGWIYRAVDIERDHELTQRMWRRAAAQFRPIDKDGMLVEHTPPPP